MFNKKEKQKDLMCFTIYDSKTESYDIPHFATNQADLIRQLRNLFSDPSQSQNKFYVNAEDYSVYSNGNYCKKTGQLEGTSLEHVLNLHELRSQLENEKATKVKVAQQDGH